MLSKSFTMNCETLGKNKYNKLSSFGKYSY